MYGVSPQPAHAPENSNNGFSNCELLTVSFLPITLRFSGNSTEYSKFSCSDLCVAISFISKASTGQVFAHT